MLAFLDNLTQMLAIESYKENRHIYYIFFLEESMYIIVILHVFFTKCCNYGLNSQIKVVSEPKEF